MKTVAISRKMQPRAKISTVRPRRAFSRSTSGAQYIRVPISIPVTDAVVSASMRSFEIPNSAIKTLTFQNKDVCWLDIFVLYFHLMKIVDSLNQASRPRLHRGQVPHPTRPPSPNIDLSPYL